MSELIEDCLRARGVRFFHGHHEREYFFLMHSRHGRIAVHLDRGGAAPDEITVTVSPDRYYPAADRDRLSGLAGRCGARVYPSSDPGLVGVVASNSGRPADAAALNDLVDDAVAVALDLFGRMGEVGLRDAG